MPIDYRSTSAELSQREAFARSRLARAYRSLLDRAIMLALGRPHRLVDVGAGEGILLEKLGEEYRREGRRLFAVALDRHPGNASICRSLGFPSVTADAQALPLADESMEVALLTNMLEHVDDPAAALREARRVLCPRGLAIVVVPHEDNFRRARMLLGRRREAHLSYGHVNRWNPRELVSLLTRQGFRVVRQRNLPLGLWPLALHHMVVACRLPAA